MDIRCSLLTVLIIFEKDRKRGLCTQGFGLVILGLCWCWYWVPIEWEGGSGGGEGVGRGHHRSRPPCYHRAARALNTGLNVTCGFSLFPLAHYIVSYFFPVCRNLVFQKANTHKKKHLKPLFIPKYYSFVQRLVRKGKESGGLSCRLSSSKY